MYPVLFSLGPLQFKTISLFYLLAFLAVGFLLWRKSREENYEEAMVFDGFIISLLWGFFFGRGVFIASHFQQFAWQPLHWLDLISKPGLDMTALTLVMLWSFYRFAIKQKWDAFEMTDFFVTALSFGALVLNIGYFFAGMQIGKPANLPWGVVFTGTFEKRHPAQIYFALVYLVLFVILFRLEYVYRTFEWYRAKKNTAQSGFITSVFFISVGILLLPLSFLKEPNFLLANMPMDWLIYLLSFIFGLGLLLNRAGRTIIPQKKKKTWIKESK